MRPNKLRELLTNNKPSLGTNAMILWPGVVEVIGHAGGFDYIQFESEYVPYDLHQLDHLGRTIELFDNMTSMIKVESEMRSHLTKRAIGSGIQNILFADIRSVEEAEESVAAVRADTPQKGGIHGSEDRRFAKYFESGSSAYIQALDDVVIALMIEKDDAVKNLDAILSVKGIDMTVFGGNDYSMSIGKPGQAASKEVQDIQDYVIKTSLKHSVQPRVGCVLDNMDRFLEMGVKHFCMGTDLATIYRWAQATAPSFWKMMDK